LWSYWHFFSTKRHEAPRSLDGELFLVFFRVTSWINLMSIHESFMAVALDEAREAYARAEVPVGAVLVGDQGEILSRGYNAPIARCDPTAHAEMVVLREAARVAHNYRLPGTTLYVTLEPCVMCLGAMMQARIGTLVFGASDPKGGALGGAVDLTKAAVFNHYIEVIGGVLAELSSGLLTRFFQERRQAQKHRGEVPKRP
jgi:tRNA(adenine34) deaminase